MGTLTPDTRSALVVDDSRTSRRMMGEILRAMNFEVTEAEHGVAAMSVLREHGPFMLVLVDWNMPEMDGLSLVQAVRHDRTYEQMPLMMVTTEHELPRVALALSAGANEYLMKPFTREMVQEKLAILGLASDVT